MIGDLVLSIKDGDLKLRTTEFMKSNIRKEDIENGVNYYFDIKSLIDIEFYNENGDVQGTISEVNYVDDNLSSYKSVIMDAFRSDEHLEGYVLDHKQGDEKLEEYYVNSNDLFPTKIRVKIRKVGSFSQATPDGIVDKNILLITHLTNNMSIWI